MGKSPLCGLSGEDHMLFKAKLCQEEEKSTFLVQTEETEMGGNRDGNRDSLVNQHCAAYFLGYNENLNLCIEKQTTEDQRPEHST